MLETLETFDTDLSRSRAKLFRGLAEPSRLRILDALSRGPLTVSEIASRTGLTQPNTSNHLACMLGCGLVVREPDGRFAYYRHADESISVLLSVADRVISQTAHATLECPHCGTAL